ncbi:hypothetical protein MmmBen468_0935 [Mycoplasma mycoides subsp. mycoides]|nr:hypothetical protein [Mycoplasma mycoides]AME12121.1 hypothetical protein MmmBen50_0963 [Mycoplasma mycoides subsp. mycoides]AME15130.1 hypothetical protein MmmBen468_0935 [Mycoplasma mycoides subsp. mycoides]
MRSKIYISMFSCFMLKLGNVGIFFAIIPFVVLPFLFISKSIT